MICKERKELLKLLGSKLEEFSKHPPSSALIATIDNLIEVSHILEAKLPCAPFTKTYWERIKGMVSELSLDKIAYSRSVSSRLIEVVPRIQESERSWYNLVRMGLGLVTILSFIGSGASIVSYLYLASWLLSFSYPLIAGFFALAVSIILSFSQTILGLTLGALTLATVYAYVPPSIDLSVKEEGSIEPPPEEELINLFEEIYGREGKKLYNFELWHLMSMGYSKEEALVELWKRLTGEKS